MNRRMPRIAISLLLIQLAGLNAAEKQAPPRGDWRAEQLLNHWSVARGRARQSISQKQWVVAAPNEFYRGLDFGNRPRTIDERGDVEIQWATESQNNYAADGLRIVTQGRGLRIHPIYQPEGPDLLLTGTSLGMTPDIPHARIDLSDLPDFDARAENIYRIQWQTNADRSFSFHLSVNGKKVAELPGEFEPREQMATLSLEFRTGPQRIGRLRWKLFQGGIPQKEKPRVLTEHPQLLFDSHLVETYRNLPRTLHQPVMHSANPVFTWKHPWEYAAVLLWGTVLFDEEDQRFKMWYMTWGNEAGGALPGYKTPVCYATSVDGLKWERPQFTHCPFQLQNPTDPDGPPRTYPKNNIVFNLPVSADGMDSPTIVKDVHDPDPQRRYKMSYWHRLPTGTGIYHAHSPDGIHWTHIPQIVARTGDRNTFHWDPFRDKWITVSRPAASFYEYQQFGKPNRDFVRTRVDFEPRDRLPPTESTDIYSFPVMNYAGMQIGVPEFYGRGTTNRWVSYLAWSHNGTTWTIDPERVPWMPWSKRAGDFDSWRRNIHNGSVIRRGDKLWIYFSGRSQGKNIPGRSGFLVPSGEPGYDPRGIVGSIGIGTLRVDGFCSRDAGRVPGSLQTKVFRFSGSQLELNADIEPGGMLRASLLDAQGRPLPGYTAENCDPISGDNLAHRVAWRGNADLTALTGTPVRLRLEFQQTRLYSFRFTKPAAAP